MKNVKFYTEEQAKKKRGDSFINSCRVYMQSQAGTQFYCITTAEGVIYVEDKSLKEYTPLRSIELATYYDSLSEADRLIDFEAKELMQDWDFENFKETHPRLYVVIRQAMVSYAQLYIAKYREELTK